MCNNLRAQVVSNPVAFEFVENGNASSDETIVVYEYYYIL